MSVQIPATLLAHAADGAWTGWLDGLPRQVDGLLDEWQLTVDGPAMAGTCAIVLPVTTSDDGAAALKVSWPHWEAETEHLALRHWAGQAAVRLLRADPRRFALLLERADSGRDLRSLPVIDAVEVVASLYPALHGTAPPQLRKLSSLAAEWSQRLPALIGHGAVPRRLIDRGISLSRDLITDSRTDGTLIHTDLHYENVLAALPGGGRPPWLVIDPKPLSGDPAYEVQPLLRNRWDELPEHRLRDGILRRLYTVVDAAGLDEDRVRDWALVRTLVNVLGDVESDTLTVEGLDRAITIAKAVQR